MISEMKIVPIKTYAIKLRSQLFVKSIIEVIPRLHSELHHYGLLQGIHIVNCIIMARYSANMSCIIMARYSAYMSCIIMARYR